MPGDNFAGFELDTDDSDSAPEVAEKPAPEVAAPVAPEVAEKPAPEVAAESSAEESSPKTPKASGERTKLPPLVNGAKPATGDKGAKGAKGAKSAKRPRVSHEDRERFAGFVGPLLDSAYDSFAASVGSPIRASNQNPNDPNNGLVYTVKFRDSTDKAIAGADAKPESAEGLRGALVRMLALETPGRTLAYHAAAIMPNVARLDAVMQEHPFLTLGAMLVATSVQFGLRVSRTQGEVAPSGAPIGVKDANGESR